MQVCVFWIPSSIYSRRTLCTCIYIYTQYISKLSLVLYPPFCLVKFPMAIGLVIKWEDLGCATSSTPFKSSSSSSSSSSSIIIINNNFNIISIHQHSSPFIHNLPPCFLVQFFAAEEGLSADELDALEVVFDHLNISGDILVVSWIAASQGGVKLNPWNRDSMWRFPESWEYPRFSSKSWTTTTY